MKKSDFSMYREKLVFDPEPHTYHYEGESCVSATTYIDGLFADFPEDANKWTATGVTNEIKKWKKSEELLESNFPGAIKLFKNSWKEEVKARKPIKGKYKVTPKEVRQLWDANSKRAADEGTRIHNLIEQALLNEIDYLEYIEEQEVVAAVNMIDRIKNLYSYTCVVYPELRIVGATEEGSLELPIAGTIDVCINFPNGRTILVDWKTNENLMKPAYKGQTGTSKATSTTPDSKIERYTLQLSLYAYILEKYYSRTIVGLFIGWLHDGQCESIEIEYKKELIEEILKEDGLA
jgi:ATP-dependent exoDNAse (exonuclease V) beta subunit